MAAAATSGAQLPGGPSRARTAAPTNSVAPSISSDGVVNHVGDDPRRTEGQYTLIRVAP